MAKYINDTAIDQCFEWVNDRVTRINVCSTQPTTYAEATSTNMLAQTDVITSTEITLADGDVSGRKMHVASQTGLSVSTSGTAAHVALTGSTGSTLLLVTTCTTQALTTGNTVNVPAFDDEIADAA